MAGIAPRSNAGIVITRNCAGNDVCSVTGTTSGFGTSTFFASLYAGGNNQVMGNDPGPGGSGSVTVDQIAKTEGPERPGLIMFTYGPAAHVASGGAMAEANFSVGDIVGTVPGEIGVPTPMAGQLVPFTLGKTFHIKLSASFDVPAAPPSRYATAQLNLSFAVFDAGPGDPVPIEDASPAS